MSDRVIELRAEDLSWPFQGGPVFIAGERHVTVDPFPCYPHDRALVAEALRKVEECVSITYPPTLYVLHFETLERTNGWANMGYKWDSDKQRSCLCPGEIILAGKRIPPHPGMTRYLVAHEYGHHVDYFLCDKREVDLHGGLDAEYAKLRGLPAGWDRYGGGRWHSNVGEFIANDFRVLVASAEPDFWPHPGYPRPENVPGLQKWWEDALSSEPAAEPTCLTK